MQGVPFLPQRPVPDPRRPPPPGAAVGVRHLRRRAHPRQERPMAYTNLRLLLLLLLLLAAAAPGTSAASSCDLAAALLAGDDAVHPLEILDLPEHQRAHRALRSDLHRRRRHAAAPASNDARRRRRRQDAGELLPLPMARLLGWIHFNVMR